MRAVYRTFLFLSMLIGAQLPAQESPARLRISAEVAESLLVRKVEPVYPQMAKIAHIEGKVVLNVIISPQGKVTSARAVSGHPILIQPVIDAVYKWEYRPFILNGQPVEVTAPVEVTFALANEPRVMNESQIYKDQEEKCNALLDQKKYAEAEAACSLLPELAHKADWDLFGENACDLSGYAYFKVSKFQDALIAWQHQLEIVKHGSSTAPGRAYFNVARALQATGDLQAAAAHYEQARSIYEAIHEKFPDMKSNSMSLQIVLRNHAALLRQMGDQAKADALEKKAASIEIKPDPANR